MDPRKQRPSALSSSGSSEGRFLQGVWMSRCEGGRVERLTKWSDDRKDKALGSLDRQQHDSMVKMNLIQLELKDELAALRRSRRRPPPLKDARDDTGEVDVHARPRARTGPGGRMVFMRDRSTRSPPVKLQETPRYAVEEGGDVRRPTYKARNSSLEPRVSRRKTSGTGVGENRTSASKGKLGSHQQVSTKGLD